MGLTLNEYKDLGLDQQPATSTDEDPNAPRSERQEAFLNDLGVVEADWPATRGECSNLINAKLPAFKQWRDQHNNEKPATGRQRKALQRRGVSTDAIDAMT